MAIEKFRIVGETANGYRVVCDKEGCDSVFTAGPQHQSTFLSRRQARLTAGWIRTRSTRAPFNGQRLELIDICPNH